MKMQQLNIVGKVMIDWLFNISKSLILIGFAGLIFYFSSPKYFFLNGGDIRGNKYTGQVERYNPFQGEWVNMMEPCNEKIKRLENLIKVEKERLIRIWKNQISELPQQNEQNVFQRAFYNSFGGGKTDEEINIRAEEIAKINLGIDDSDLQEVPYIDAPFRLIY